jgi:hypothetical protein
LRFTIHKNHYSSGNVCSSCEHLNSEKTSTSIWQLDQNRSYAYVEHPLCIVTKHYADPDGRSQYIVGLSADQVELHQPAMGFDPVEIGFTYYKFHAQGQPFDASYAVMIDASTTDESKLDSADFTTVKDVLRSFRINN